MSFGQASRMSRNDLARLVGAMGYNEIDACTIMRIVERESARYPAAVSRSGDLGLCQPNRIHIPRLVAAGVITSEADMFDPEVNIRATQWLVDNDISYPGWPGGRSTSDVPPPADEPPATDA